MGVFAETVFFAVPRLVSPKLGEKGGNLAISTVRLAERVSDNMAVLGSLIIKVCVTDSYMNMMFNDTSFPFNHYQY